MNGETIFYAFTIIFVIIIIYYFSKKSMEQQGITKFTVNSESVSEESKESNESTTTTTEPLPLTINEIASKYILTNYLKPMLTNNETNVITHGKFVILDESSDILQELSLNIVLSTMYFEDLHIYVIRGIKGESLQHCYIHSKTLDNVCIPQDYTTEPEFKQIIKKNKSNEPLNDVLQFDDSKKYYPLNLQSLIEFNAKSFLQRTTMNLNGIDSKRV